MRGSAAGLVGLALLALPAPGLAAEAVLPPGGAAMLAWTPDQQIVGFRAMEKMNPTHVIRRGAHVHKLEVAAATLAPTWTWKGERYEVASYMAKMRTSGVVVLKDGRVVLERYGLGRSSNDRWISWSVAKSVTSTLVGAAIQDGHIKSLDAKVSDYIPELRDGAYDDVTVRQLLTMTSGVKWNEDYSDPNSDVARAGAAAAEPGVNPIVSYMRRLPRAAPPGEQFAYKTGETDLAGVLVSRAVGKPLSAYLSERIWAPYGMERDGVWLDDAAGHERGGCCISMTLRDYARFGQFMLDGGRIGSRAVVPAGWVADATSARVEFNDKMHLPSGMPERGYGYFWWILNGGFAAEGIFGQQIVVYPKEHVVIAINSAWTRPDDFENWKAQAAFLEAIRAAADGIPPAAGS